MQKPKSDMNNIASYSFEIGYVILTFINPCNRLEDWAGMFSLFKKKGLF